MKTITIGRNPDNNVVVNDATVGRHHVQIIQQEDGLVRIVDLNSKNGTFVNGKRITGEAFLNPGDQVTIGLTNLPWEEYVTPDTAAKKKKMIILTSTIGGVLLAVVIVAVVLLVTGKNQNPAESQQEPPSRGVKIVPAVPGNAFDDIKGKALEAQQEAEEAKKEAKKAKDQAAQDINNANEAINDAEIEIRDAELEQEAAQEVQQAAEEEKEKAEEEKNAAEEELNKLKDQGKVPQTQPLKKNKEKRKK